MTRSTERDPNQVTPNRGLSRDVGAVSWKVQTCKKASSCVWLELVNTQKHSKFKLTLELMGRIARLPRLEHLLQTAAPASGSVGDLIQLPLVRVDVILGAGDRACQDYSCHKL